MALRLHGAICLLLSVRIRILLINTIAAARAQAIILPFTLKIYRYYFSLRVCTADYHRPTDDADKINYTGEYRIVKYIYKIIETTNNKGKLAFSKTRETRAVRPAKLNVTMGIMPDYTFSGNGVRADGISDGRPAQKAGLKPGDIIVQLGEYPVLSVENYMQVLNKFKKGDKTTVKIKSGEQLIQADVQF